ncbi:hypothetical protein ACWDKQ_02165 [Saccharopolyspora sp. NPDC000995]
MTITQGTPRSSQTAALDDLGELLTDWRRHLRATNTAPSTIVSYLNVAGWGGHAAGTRRPRL